MNKLIVPFALYILCNGFFTINAQLNSIVLEEIMKGKDFSGHWPENPSYLPNGEVIFRWNPDKKILSEYFAFSENKIERVNDKALNYIPKGNLLKHPLANYYAYLKDGRIIKWNSNDPSPKIIYESYDWLHSLHMVNNPNKLYFIKDNLLCSMATDSSCFKEVLKFSNSTEKKKSKDKQEDYLDAQQKFLFDYYDIVEKTEKSKEVYQEKETSWRNKTIVVEKGVFKRAFISGDESAVVYYVSDRPKQHLTEIEDYVTKTGWSSSKKARPKVGRPDTKHQLFNYVFEKDTSILVSVDHLSGVYNRPIFHKFYEKEDFIPQLENPKDVIFHSPIFNKKGNLAIVEIKSLDNKDRWITVLDVSTGKLSEIEHQHDDAWIGGPGISGWNGVRGAMGWIDNDKSIWFQSEESGYSHIYLTNISSLKKNAITKGNFEVRDARLSIDEEVFYVTLNKMDHGNRNFYHLNWRTKQLVPILEKEGNYQVEISLDEKSLAYRYSTKNTPWELFVCENKPDVESKQVTFSQSKAFKKYEWRNPPIVHIKGQDETNIPARLYQPEKGKSNGAGVIFVHGAGYLQNAHNWWSSYYREYMFHNLLCDLGYTVLDIDYRGSEGYGKDWRTAIYRYMGGWDLNDQLSGREYLINQLNIDENRIGIYGGSYGGFITLMALLTKPGKFKCGAALRSVTDWSHYNHAYTSNILNTPYEDSLAFQKSSPIYYAENLSDHLLMLHGVLDDNVQFQDVVRLSQRFIEFKKENWELALYPVESHGFKQSSSWYDEYRRILKLFEEQLNQR